MSQEDGKDIIGMIEETEDFFRAYRLSVDGYEVLVGRDAQSNDYISTRLARPNDYWFHLKGDSGSHVLLRCHEKEEVPSSEILQKVASLAVYYSKQKKAGKTPVVCTLAKYVSKPKNAPPGLVTVSKEKILKVVPKSVEEIQQKD